MDSTIFDAPPRKLTLIAIGGVVGIHVLTAMALIAIEPSTPMIKITETPPIEIQMVTLPVEVSEPEVFEEKVVIEEMPAPKATPEPKPEPVVEPIQPKVAPTPKPVEKIIEKTIAPVVPKKIQEKPPEPIKEPEPIKQPIVTTAPVKKQPRIISENTALAAQEQAEKQRQITAAQDAKRAAEEAARAQHVADAKAAQEAAETAKAEQQAKAARDAEAAARAQADAQAKADADAKAKAEAASNTPMNFSASNANWRSRPNFSFPSRAARGASSGDTFNLVLLLRVNKQGGIDSVSLAQSSGNAILDKEAQRQVRSGKFKPFMNNAGVPVVGNVTLPVSYAMP